MNGLDNILSRLEDQANQEIVAILDQAQADAAAITAEYTAQAKALEEALTQKATADAAQKAQRMESAADMEGRKASLAAKQDLVSHVFDQAEQAILDLPQDQYIAFVAGALAQAAPSGVGQVILAEKDQGAVADAILAQANSATGGKLTLSAESRSIRGGFILVDEKLEINAAVETLVRMQRSQLASEVASILFAQP